MYYRPPNVKEPIDKAFADSRDGTLRLPDDYIYLYDGTARYIALKLKQRPDITVVDLRGHEDEGGITDKGAKALAEVPTIRSLNLSNQRITDEGAKALAKNKNLKILDLDYNPDLTDASARAFANNDTLESLDLSNNRITDEGTKALAGNHVLRSLSLDGNSISDEGAEALAANTTLQLLCLNYNDITDEGARAFLHNENLTHLEIDENRGVGAAVLNEVQRKIDRNRERPREAGR